MESFKTFITKTKTTTRILFLLWILLSALSNSVGESKILTISRFAIILLPPIVLIELKKNPMFESSHSKIILFIKRAKRISKILFCLWLINLFTIFETSSVSASPNLTFGSVIFLLPAILLELKNFSTIEIFTDSTNSAQYAQSEESNNRVLSKSLVTGLFFIPMALICSITYLQTPIDNPASRNIASGNLSMAIVFGILAITFLLISRRTPKSNIEDITTDEHIKGEYRENVSFIDDITPKGTEDVQKEEDLPLSNALVDNIVSEYTEATQEEETLQLNNLFVSSTNSKCTESMKSKARPRLTVSSVDGMDGREFEYFCADLLAKNGFSNVEVTPRSGDQGVDILAEKEEVKYAIQCKNFISKLDNTPVQEVNAGRQFYKCDIAIVLTNSTFTPGARELASAIGVRLWDRAKLQELMDNAHKEQLLLNQQADENIDDNLAYDNDVLIEIDSTLTELSNLLDLATNSTTPIEEAFNRFSNVLEQTTFQSVPLEKELFHLGKTIKEIGVDLSKTNEQIKIKTLSIFSLLERHNYSECPFDLSFIESFNDVHKVQQELIKELIFLKNSIAKMENPCNINAVDFRLAKHQALCDFEQGIFTLKKASSNFTDILTEYKKFKPETNK